MAGAVGAVKECRGERLRVQLSRIVGERLSARAARSTYFVLGLISLPFLLRVFVILHKILGQLQLCCAVRLARTHFLPNGVPVGVCLDWEFSNQRFWFRTVV